MSDMRSNVVRDLGAYIVKRHEIEALLEVAALYERDAQEADIFKAPVFRAQAQRLFDEAMAIELKLEND